MNAETIAIILTVLIWTPLYFAGRLKASHYATIYGVTWALSTAILLATANNEVITNVYSVYLGYIVERADIAVDDTKSYRLSRSGAQNLLPPPANGTVAALREAIAENVKIPVQKIVVFREGHFPQQSSSVTFLVNNVTTFANDSETVPDRNDEISVCWWKKRISYVSLVASFFIQLAPAPDAGFIPGESTDECAHWATEPWFFYSTSIAHATVPNISDSDLKTFFNHQTSSKKFKEEHVIVTSIVVVICFLVWLLARCGNKVEGGPVTCGICRGESISENFVSGTRLSYQCGSCGAKMYVYAPEKGWVKNS
jgi:hypothetical protein